MMMSTQLLSCLVVAGAVSACLAVAAAGPDHSGVPGVVIDYSPASSGKYILFKGVRVGH